MMRQIERFVSAASLPVSRLLEHAGLKGALLAEASAEIEARALAAQRQSSIAVPAPGASAPGRVDDGGEPVDWLVRMLADSVVRALAPATKRRESPRAALAGSLGGSRKLQRTLGALRELCRSDGARVTEALAAEGAPAFLVHAPIDLEYTLGRSSRLPITETLLRAREIMRLTQARVLAFVPYDPRRPAALAIVREAMSRGFVGVVFEPRDGTRIIGNAGNARAKEIERRLIDLYSYCAEANVPLLVPCESAFDEGKPDARGRLRDLKRLLGTRRFGRLRLCIGGVGSLDGWSAAKRGDRAAFARSEAGLALGLAETFSNVFCDVSGTWPDGKQNASAIRARINDAAQRKRAIDGKLISAGRDDTLVEWLRFTSLAQAPTGLDEAEESAILASLANVRAGDGEARVRSLGAVSRSLASAATAVVDCLVLGAGISGVTAARDVASWRRRDGTSPSVLILEASQRIGGRMHTLRDARLPIPVELGAELIHRPEADQASGGFRLWDEVRRYGLETRPIDKTSSNLVFLRNWSSNTNGPKLRGALGTCSDIDVGNGKRVLDSCMRTRHGDDRSALVHREVILDDFNARRANAEDMADYLLTGTVPGELEDLSVAGLASDRVKEQEFSSEEYHVAAGYDTLPAFIASGVPIEFGADVRRIEWWNVPGDAGVRVVTADGREFVGRTAVCTFSIGVLCRAGIEFARVAPDAPMDGLPPAKREAIARIGFGAESKLVMQFAARFWPDDLSILSSPGRGMRAGRSFFNPSYEAPGAPAILTAFLTRRSAEEFDALVGDAERSKGDGKPEAHIEDYLRDRVLADLIEILDLPAAKRPALKDVTHWHCRCWGNDPHVLGGTSYLRFVPGTSCATMRSVRAALADARETQPLFWAGEAAAVNTNPWSVHGAHMSGVAAGIQVANLLAAL